MQNIPSELIITVKNYINITSFKMKGSPDLGQAVKGIQRKRKQDINIKRDFY